MHIGCVKEGGCVFCLLLSHIIDDFLHPLTAIKTTSAHRMCEGGRRERVGEGGVGVSHDWRVRIDRKEVINNSKKRKKNMQIIMHIYFAFCYHTL